MQSAWCIIQWPPVGGFSQCCDHNVCAQTLLQLWIHNEKVLKDTNCAHSSPSLWGQETQKIAVEIRFLVSPEKQQIMTEYVEVPLAFTFISAVLIKKRGKGCCCDVSPSSLLIYGFSFSSSSSSFSSSLWFYLVMLLWNLGDSASHALCFLSLGRPKTHVEQHTLKNKMQIFQ